MRCERAFCTALKVIKMVKELVEQTLVLRHNGAAESWLVHCCKYLVEHFSEDRCVMQTGSTSNERCSLLFLEVLRCSRARWCLCSEYSEVLCAQVSCPVQSMAHRKQMMCWSCCFAESHRDPCLMHVTTASIGQSFVGCYFNAVSLIKLVWT